jgi:hypothetical protein
MRTNRFKTLSTFIFGLLACWKTYAGEQDNWYLAREWSLSYGTGVAYHEDNTTGIGQIYVVCENGNRDIKVYDLNGSLARSITIASNRYYPRDLVLDENGTIYIAERYAVTCLDNNGSFRWRKGRNATISNYGSNGSGNGEFNSAWGITLGNDKNLYISDYSNHRVQVLDKNGSFIRKFGTYGSAPGQFRHPNDIISLQNGTIVVGDSYYLHFFEQDGTFIKRVNTSNARGYVSVSKDGSLFSYQRLRDQDGTQIAYLNNINDNSRTCFTPEGDLIVSYNNKVQIWKRAYRTKGLPTRNVIPQPAIRSISQRSGTNIIDIDFEIVDPDDANATVGILAAKNGQFTSPGSWIIPTAWVDGTGSKIGTPVSTNQVHRASWNVKGDWPDQTGTLKFEVFCKDARRTSPVDLHFLQLPLPDGNVTISRSPIKDSDFANYFKYLLATGSSAVSLDNDRIKDTNGTVLLETNLQVSPAGKNAFMNAIGHRWAKQAELSLAKEASTPGGVNAWTPTGQIMPRNLPNKVNEFGFDTGSHGSRAWWVVKASTLPIPNFEVTPFDINGSQNQYFGRNVAIAGDRVVIGFGDSNQRKLYHYDANDTNGSLQYLNQVVPNSTSSNQAKYFGQAFALDGNSIVVGAREAYANNHGEAGAIFLFDFNGSTTIQKARISASDGNHWDMLGYSVDMSGDLIVGGAFGEDIAGNSNSGAAYLFKREANGTITELGKLIHEDPKSGDYFGVSIAIENDIVAVGAHEDDVLVSGSNRSNAGSVTLFKVDGAGNITRSATLTAPSPASSVYFGRTVSMAGNFLAVGEYNRNHIQSYSGAVYLYKINANGTAQLTATLHSPNPSYQGYFGFSVDLSGDRLVVGAYNENSEIASNSGSAYIYKVKPDGSVSLLEVLTHPSAKSSDRLGISVGTSGRLTVVGADNFDPPPDKWNAGGAVLFRSSF